MSGDEGWGSVEVLSQVFLRIFERIFVRTSQWFFFYGFLKVSSKVLWGLYGFVEWF